MQMQQYSMNFGNVLSNLIGVYGYQSTSSISIYIRLKYPLHEICLPSSELKIDSYYATSKPLKSSTSCKEYLFQNSSSSTFVTALQMNTG